MSRLNFEIHQQWQSVFWRVYSNCCSNCSFEPEIIKIGQSSHMMYSNNIVNFQASTTILNTCTKNVWKIFEGSTYVSVTIAKSYVWLSFCSLWVFHTRLNWWFFTELWVTKSLHRTSGLFKAFRLILTLLWSGWFWFFILIPNPPFFYQAF